MAVDAREGLGEHQGVATLAPVPAPAVGSAAPPATAAADVAIALADLAVQLAMAAATRAGRVADRLAPATRLVMRPPGVPYAASPARLLSALTDRGRARRAEIASTAVRVVRAAIPVVFDAVLDELDLTAIVRERVDVDGLVARVDLERILARVDVDAIVARADIDAVLDRVDVNDVAARVDLDAIIERLQLIELAQYVVNGIDLPGIIRESSSSMASEAVQGVRMQGLQADQALYRAVDKWVRHRGRGGDGQ